ncbi:MAG TPA: hypothetical protein VHC20_02485 [Candidatus Paceibacterota bacterium]|nr:hypothetical protein [Candidatus Paceibacterota bacterium]
MSTATKLKPLPFTTDPWSQLEEGVPYCLVGQPTWIDQIGGRVLLAVRRRDTQEVFTFLIELEVIPSNLRVSNAFVVTNGRVSAAL